MVSIVGRGGGGGWQGGPSDLVWTFRKRENSLATTGICTLDLRSVASRYTRIDYAIGAVSFTMLHQESTSCNYG
jgi:hypothetical protein